MKASRRLEKVFDHCFSDCECTRLCGGAPEPFYRPAGADDACNVLHYREDYVASALHEVAHWCIAGAERRRLPDFGYWYLPDGRNPAQQRAFERVEYRPQALEWFFSKACGHRFRLSVDNLHAAGTLPEIGEFAGLVLAQARRWQDEGLPSRAARFYFALCREFGTTVPAGELEFRAEELT